MRLKSFLTLSAIVAASLLNAQTEAEDNSYAVKSHYDPGYQITGRENEYGMIAPDGNIIFDTEYRSTLKGYNLFAMEGGIAYYFHNEAFVLKNRANKIGVIQNYKVVVPFEYDMIYVRQHHVDGVITVDYVLVEKDNMVYSYDIATKKQSLVAPSAKIYYMREEMDKIYGGLVRKENSLYTYNPSSGLVAINHDNPETLMVVCYNDFYGLINGKGAIVLPAEYDYIYEINMDGAFICAQKNGREGVVNAQGEEIVPFKYESTSLLTAYDPNTEQVFYAIEVQENAYIAIFDIQGNRLTDFKYTGVSYATEGLYDDRYGVILELDKDSIHSDFLEVDGTITPYGQ